MCRITGYWDFNDRSNYDKASVLINMRDSLSYGGPDSAGIYECGNMYLGHRRLSIIDLSTVANQPMRWNDLVIIFNGEIYNFTEVKTELLKHGITFTTNSDTEVILKAFEKWGKDCVQRFRGMFAFAIWDEKNQKLILCRDRIGVKPLFWYFHNNVFLFASELKAFHHHPAFVKEINHEAIALFLQKGFIHSPYCVFKHTWKIKPGSWLEINNKGEISEYIYWDVEEKYAAAEPNKKDEDELAEELEKLLVESFQLRLVSDVPVGIFLSGGIDSSLVTTLLQKNSSSQLKTFTIGFYDKVNNEAEHAKSIAKFLGTNHTELYCTENDFKSLISLLPVFYDEPFGDSSAIPTHLVSKLAREQVTVSLSADGADELFGGYTKYEIAKNFFHRIRRLPTPVNNFISYVTENINPDRVEQYTSKMPLLKSYKGVSTKFYKFRNAVASKNIEEFFDVSSSYTSYKELRNLISHKPISYNPSVRPKNDLLISYLGMIDIKTYLEGDIMTKVDRATMQIALEGREPFLDHKVIEFALGLPENMKIRKRTTKYLLRRILNKHIPLELTERPKWGFAIPIKDWLLKILKDELFTLSLDKEFANTFHLNQVHLKFLISNFIHQRSYVNPAYIWFLYCLFVWYKQWFEKYNN